MSQGSDNFKKRSVRSKPELPQDLIDLPEAPVRRNRKSKSERLRELTEKLKQSWLAESGAGDVCSCESNDTTVQTEDCGNAGDTEAAADSALPVAVELDPEVDLTLQRPKARTIVGAYIQRTIPFRSASFSQVDVASDGKYIRSSKPNPSSSGARDVGNLTLPRHKAVAASTSENAASQSDITLCSIQHPPLLRCNALLQSADDLCQEILVEDVQDEADRCKDTNNGLPPVAPSNIARRKQALHRHEWKSEPCQSFETETPSSNNDNLSLRNYRPNSKEHTRSEVSNAISRDRVRVPVYYSEEDDETDECSLIRSSENFDVAPTRRRARRRRKDYPEAVSEVSGPRLLTYNAVVAPPISTTIETPLLHKLTNNNLHSLIPSCSFEDSSTLSEGDSSQLDTLKQQVCCTSADACSETRDDSLVVARKISDVTSEDDYSGGVNKLLTNESCGQGEDSSSTWPVSTDVQGSPDIRIESTSGSGGSEWCWDTTLAQTNEPRAVTPQSDGGGGNCHRLAPLLRNDSLSEGESDSSSRRSGAARAASCGTSPSSPRRYNKRPLRGPYGQMLEAEMKRASPAKLLPRELGFLENLQQTMPQPQPRRKTSAYQMSESGVGAVATGTSVSPASGPIAHVHQRAASSPCQLIGLEEQERNKDTRTHVVVELYETEKSYVEALQTLVKKYLNPLKGTENSGLVEAAVVDEIFYQVPSILQHHEGFLDDLNKRLDSWDVRQKIGDIFLEVFTRQSVIDCYTAFINNWQQAKTAIRNTCQSKPAFARFLEATSREHKGKLALDSLLIMPVQRIPRYELLIQTLLKHTTTTHPDYPFLVSAQRAIHALAVTINCREKESCEAELQMQQLRELESLLDGAGRLASPDRTFLRHDAVTATVGSTSKERMLFLFSDMLLIASVKRRSGTIRKPSASGMFSVTNTLDANKYKTLMKFSHTDLEIVKARDETVRRLLQELAEVAEDLNLTSRLIELSNHLHCSHVAVDETLRDLQTTLSRQLAEKQSGENGLNCLELSLVSQGETISLVFGKPEQRASWEEAFTEAKQKLALSAERRPSPEFLSPLAIRKTRAGLQFTCATATLGPPNDDGIKHGPRDVWVCNSDGYVGQVCVLSLQNEPTVTSCNGVCNARILCIAAIPVPVIPSCSLNFSDDSANCRKTKEEEYEKPRNMQFESSSSSSDDDECVEEAGEVTIDSCQPLNPGNEEVLDESDSLLQPTMWLGTEDGYIHVYNSTDNIRIKKNKIKIHHGSAVHCIIYLENRVFVSLANGDVVVYTRDNSSLQWNTTDPCCVTVGTPATPVTRMVCVGDEGFIWCACQNTIRVLNINTLQVEGSFTIGSEYDRPIHCLTCSELAVWISVYNSANVRLYHGITMEALCDVNVAPAVTKMLASCDDIIRQHKAACLRVTALLACQDLLWVGTSAGVILTIPIPHLSSSTSKLPSTPAVIGIPHGHTGHVRFLTSVQMDPEVPKTVTSNHGINSSSQNAGKTLVISGGDGYEDFRSSSLSEIAGREDSTNHLLLWRV